MVIEIEYICHPVSGHVEQNIADIKRISRERHTDTRIPFVPYGWALQYLDDTNPDERALGVRANRAFFENGTIDRIYVCGHRVSRGMREEIILAYHNNITIDAEPHLRPDVMKILPFHNSYVGQRRLPNGNSVIVLRNLFDGAVLAFETDYPPSKEDWDAGTRGVPLEWNEAPSLHWRNYKHRRDEMLERIVDAWSRREPIGEALAV